MLRVWSVAGKELASLATEELSTAQALKQQLRAQHGIPASIPMKLLHDGTPLDDAATLDRPMDVDMVLLPISSAEMGQVANELSESAARGHVEVVRWLLQAGADKALDSTLIGKTALLRASDQGQAEIVHLLLGASADKDLVDMSLCHSWVTFYMFKGFKGT